MSEEFLYGMKPLAAFSLDTADDCLELSLSVMITCMYTIAEVYENSSTYHLYVCMYVCMYVCKYEN